MTRFVYVLIISAFLFAAAALAQGQTRLENVGSGLVLAVQGQARAGAPLITAKRDDYAQQVFVFRRNADGWYTLVHTGSQLAVGCAMGSKANGTRLILWTPDGSPNQQWRWVERPKGSLLQNRASGTVIGVFGGSTRPGAAVILWQDDGAPNQLWLFR